MFFPASPEDFLVGLFQTGKYLVFEVFGRLASYTTHVPEHPFLMRSPANQHILVLKRLAPKHI